MQENSEKPAATPVLASDILNREKNVSTNRKLKRRGKYAAN